MRDYMIAIIIVATAALCIGLTIWSHEARAQEPETNYTVLNQIRIDLNEMEQLIRKYEEGTVEIWPGYNVAIPAAIKTQIKTRAGTLRAKVRADLLLLSLD